MNERLKELRKLKNLSQKEMAGILNLSQNHVSALEHGTRKLTERLIEDICREFNVNKEWLVNGTGECFKNTLDMHTHLDKETRQLVENFMELDDEAKDYIMGLINKMNTLKK